MKSLPSTAETTLRDAIGFPNDAIARLYDQAKGGQWNIDREIAWDEMELGCVPKGVRAAMSAIYTQIQYGEMIALIGAARLVNTAPQRWTKLMASMQVADEARHVEFFARVVSRLDSPSEVCEELRCFAEEISRLESPEELLLATQVLLESMAQTVFKAGFELAQARAPQTVRLPGRDAAMYLLDTLARYIGRDEARHIAFGVTYLRTRFAHLAEDESRRLLKATEHWSNLLTGSIRGLDAPLRTIGLSANEVLERVEATNAHHLRQVGLSAQPTTP